MRSHISEEIVEDDIVQEIPDFISNIQEVEENKEFARTRRTIAVKTKKPSQDQKKSSFFGSVWYCFKISLCCCYIQH